MFYLSTLTNMPSQWYAVFTFQSFASFRISLRNVILGESWPVTSPFSCHVPSHSILNHDCPPPHTCGPVCIFTVHLHLWNVHPLTTPQGSSMGSPKKDGTRKEMHVHSGSSIEAIWEFQGIRYLESRQQLGWWISNVSGWLGWMLFLRSPLPGCLVGDLVGERNSSHCVNHVHGC